MAETLYLLARSTGGGYKRVPVVGDSIAAQQAQIDQLVATAQQVPITLEQASAAHDALAEAIDVVAARVIEISDRPIGPLPAAPVVDLGPLERSVAELRAAHDAAPPPPDVAPLSERISALEEAVAALELAIDAVRASLPRGLLKS